MWAVCTNSNNNDCKLGFSGAEAQGAPAQFLATGDGARVLARQGIILSTMRGDSKNPCVLSVTDLRTQKM